VQTSFVQSSAFISEALRVVATIHHSHGIKVAVAAGHLQRRFPNWTDDFWKAALRNAKWSEECLVSRPFVVSPFEKFVAGAHDVAARARSHISRSVLPAAYATTRAWLESEGVGRVCESFLPEACADPQYLGHRLSVLLSFAEAAPLWKHHENKALFSDRLCEFLIACRFNGMRAESSERVEISQARVAACVRPGFYGHHIIALMWALRNQHRLSHAMLNSVLHHVTVAAQTQYHDDEDNVQISPAADAELTDVVLEAALRNLLLQGQENLHAITLADALLWMWRDAADQERRFLLAIARAFTRNGET
jgi:hypothetical protein